MPESAGHPALDVDRIVEVLARYGVDYLLVGGVAGRLYGAERLTFDLDVLARLEIDNLERVARGADGTRGVPSGQRSRR